MVEEGTGKQEFLPGFPTVDQFTQNNLRKILLATKLSNDLPGEKRADYDYYSTFAGFRAVMQSQSQKIRGMIRSQLQFHGINSGVAATQIDDIVELLTETNDVILERISMSLDEATGVRRDVNPLLLEVSLSNVNTVSGSWNNFQRGRNNTKMEEVKLLTARQVLRPQVKFKHLIDNSPAPFVPRLTEKPHALKPLSILVEYDDKDSEFFSHPYLFEIDRLAPRQSQLENEAAVRPPGVETTELLYVDTREKLLLAIQELRGQPAIGLDLEAHSFRSYQGISCLIQISVPKKDYIIDPFDIWQELTLLNEITADPKIVKVLHGCEKDVEWLQRDFSVYLVNVFDTHQAGKLLSLPRLSLAWLLENYCGVMADKQYQLADWRIRPLPAEMMYYARQDTRYLLYLYHRLKEELLRLGNEQKNLLLAAIAQSNDLTRRMYVKPRLEEDSHLDLLRKSKAVLNNRQLFALKEIYSWRDKTARTEDESTAFVLPNHMLLKICTELPREMQGILACCNPVPPLVKQHLQTLHMIIFHARNKQLETLPTVVTLTSSNAPLDNNETDYNENPLKCPLDLGRMAELGPMAATGCLVDRQLDRIVRKFRPAPVRLLKSKPDLDVFHVKRDKPTVSEESKAARPSMSFVSPFKRYELLRPYLDTIDREEERQRQMHQQQKQLDTKPSEVDLRIETIKLHFQKLTDMTPVPKKTSAPDNEDEEEEKTGAKKSSVAEEDEEEEDGLPYVRSNSPRPKRITDNRSVKTKKGELEEINRQASEEVKKRKADIERKLTEEQERERARQLKRKSQELADLPSKVPKLQDEAASLAFDYSQVDFQQMFSAQKSATAGGATTNDFNPNRSAQQDKKKKHSGGGKPKQRMKGGGGGLTFNK